MPRLDRNGLRSGASAAVAGASEAILQAVAEAGSDVDVLVLSAEARFGAAGRVEGGVTEGEGAGAAACLPAASAPVIMPKSRSSCCRSCSARRSSRCSRRSSACSSRSSRASSSEIRRSSAERCHVRKLASALSRWPWPPLPPPCSLELRPPRRRFLCLAAASGWGAFLSC